jgi:hypothetical protein
LRSDQGNFQAQQDFRSIDYRPQPSNSRAKLA